MAIAGEGTRDEHPPSTLWTVTEPTSHRASFAYLEQHDSVVKQRFWISGFSCQSIVVERRGDVSGDALWSPVQHASHVFLHRHARHVSVCGNGQVSWVGSGRNGLRRGSVFRTSVFGRRTNHDLCPIYGWQVTTLCVNCPLWVSQLGQLNLKSLQGR